jgi:glycosyltransferase involved in cell wall biosynthesis
VSDLSGRERRINVTFVIGSLALGGAETQLVRLVNGLDRTRFNASIITLWEGDDLVHQVAPDVAIHGSRLALGARRFPGRRAVMATRIILALVVKLRRQRPDMVHAYLPAAYILGGLAAWALRVRVIIASRRGLTSFDALGPRRWVAFLANRAIDVQICNSTAVRDWAVAREGIAVERMRVIHNGIDLPRLEEGLRLPPEWRSNGVAAAMVANLIRYKGHREVLAAVARVSREHPSFRLVLMGDGPELPALTELIRELGIGVNVILAGRQRNAAGLLQAFDFTLLGSSEEGFPNALMESMAAAVPVVSTAVGGVSELVDDRVHGRLVPYGDIGAMAEAITWMIDHPEERRRMGLNARDRIAKEFSTDFMVRKTTAVYEELLGDRSAARAAQ